MKLRNLFFVLSFLCIGSFLIAQDHDIADIFLPGNHPTTQLHPRVSFSIEFGKPTLGTFDVLQVTWKDGNHPEQTTTAVIGIGAGMPPSEKAEKIQGKIQDALIADGAPIFSKTEGNKITFEAKGDAKIEGLKYANNTHQIDDKQGKEATAGGEPESIESNSMRYYLSGTPLDLDANGGPSTLYVGYGDFTVNIYPYKGEPLIEIAEALKQGLQKLGLKVWLCINQQGEFVIIWNVPDNGIKGCSGCTDIGLSQGFGIFDSPFDPLNLVAGLTIVDPDEAMPHYEKF